MKSRVLSFSFFGVCVFSSLLAQARPLFDEKGFASFISGHVYVRDLFLGISKVNKSLNANVSSSIAPSMNDLFEILPNESYVSDLHRFDRTLILPSGSEIECSRHKETRETSCTFYFVDMGNLVGNRFKFVYNFTRKDAQILSQVLKENEVFAELNSQIVGELDEHGDPLNPPISETFDLQCSKLDACQLNGTSSR